MYLASSTPRVVVVDDVVVVVVVVVVVGGGGGGGGGAVFCGDAVDGRVLRQVYVGAEGEEQGEDGIFYAEVQLEAEMLELMAESFSDCSLESLQVQAV